MPFTVRKHLAVALAAAGVVGLTTPSALADTLKVPQDHATIQLAVSSAAAGDTVLISSGTYVENVVIPSGLDGLIVRGKGQVFLDAQATMGVEGSSDGILVQSNGVTISKVTIRHAASVGVRAFPAAEGLADVSGLTIDKVTLINSNDSAIRIQGDGATVTGCLLIGNGGGIDIAGANAEIFKCTIDVIEDGRGIIVVGDNVLVFSNTVSNTCRELIDVTSNNGVISKNKVSCGDSDGIDATGTNITISKNTVSDTGDDDDGIVVSSTDGALVEGNKVFRATAEGYELSITNGVVTKNLAERCGSEDEGGFLISGSGNTIDGNTAKACDSAGFGISGSNNSITGNRAFDNTDNGIVLFSFSEGGPSSLNNTVEKNTCRGNQGEGFENQGGNTMATGNSLLKNRLDLANRGMSGATMVDGGGNKFGTGGFTTEAEID